jgi:UDP-N-acetylmuramoyl-tripeptide--D-alanyl-D-alanine ligase
VIALTLAEIADALGGRIVRGVADAVVSGSVETDSRLVGPGAVFVALPGETTDGALFAPAAAEAGAALVIAEKDVEVDTALIVVDDGVAALAALARLVVARVRALGRLKVVAITGSNGKTTTKNLLRAVLAPEGATVAPEGSFNNHVGAPISMLRVDEWTEYLIVEMGASKTGEIARLVAIATPDIGIVLKVGLAHAGEFGGIDAVQRAKAEMVIDLPADAVALLHGDDPRVAEMAGMTAARVVRFGLGDVNDVRADDLEATATGTTFDYVADGARHPVALRILGEHHVTNALAALAAARELGVPVERAVVAIEGVARAERWRMEVLERGDGVTVINDAYNASPDSTAAALKTLVQVTAPDGRSIAVIGEMAELGEYADEEHDRVGLLAVRLNVAQLVVVGERARRIHSSAGLQGSWDGESVFVADADEAYAFLRGELRPGDTVLVKSSKSAGLRFLGDRLAGITS